MNKINGKNNYVNNNKTDDEIKLEQFLQEYHTKLGLKQFTFSETSLDFCLSFQKEDLRKLSSEECSENSYLVSREALLLQREINKHKSILEWSESRLTKLTIDKLQNYDKYLPWHQKRILAIQDDNYLQQLFELSNRARFKLESLQFLPTILNKIADSLMEMSRTKRKSI